MKGNEIVGIYKKKKQKDTINRGDKTYCKEILAISEFLNHKYSGNFLIIKK